MNKSYLFACLLFIGAFAFAVPFPASGQGVQSATPLSDSSLESIWVQGCGCGLGPAEHVYNQCEIAPGDCTTCVIVLCTGCSGQYDAGCAAETGLRCTGSAGDGNCTNTVEDCGDRNVAPCQGCKYIIFCTSCDHGQQSPNGCGSKPMTSTC